MSREHLMVSAGLAIAVALGGCASTAASTSPSTLTSASSSAKPADTDPNAVLNAEPIPGPEPIRAGLDDATLAKYLVMRLDAWNNAGFSEADTWDGNGQIADFIDSVAAKNRDAFLPVLFSPEAPKTPDVDHFIREFTASNAAVIEAHSATDPKIFGGDESYRRYNSLVPGGFSVQTSADGVKTFDLDVESRSNYKKTRFINKTTDAQDKLLSKFRVSVKEQGDRTLIVNISGSPLMVRSTNP